MTITREWLAYITERENRWRGNLCIRERSRKGLWDIYRKYVGIWQKGVIY